MAKIELSRHARDMLIERNIPEEWVWHTIDAPDTKQMGEDDNMHFMKMIEEYGGCVLHVVVNPHERPNRVVTVFFDRRMSRQQTGNVR